MKYLAWAVSGVPEFQLKLSIRPCQALSLKYLFYGERLQKVRLCAGFILRFVAVLAPSGARNATVSHTPPSPRAVRACPRSWFGKGLRLSEGSPLFSAIGCHQGKGGKTELVEKAESDESSKILSPTWGTQFTVEDWFQFLRKQCVSFPAFRPSCCSFLSSFSLSNTDFFWWGKDSAKNLCSPDC